MLTKRQKGLIRALMYPVQFESDPTGSVDRVLRVAIVEKSLGGDADEYASAIKSALDSQEHLADLLPEAQEESVVRKYLQQVQRKLAHEESASRTLHVQETSYKLRE